MTGRAITAAAMATKSALRFRTRKPSCFSSCSQLSPTGTFVASTGRAGRMKPGGRRRSRARGERINIGRWSIRPSRRAQCGGLAHGPRSR